jgi:hypothetical protein
MPIADAVDGDRRGFRMHAATGKQKADGCEPQCAGASDLPTVFDKAPPLAGIGIAAGGDLKNCSVKSRTRS